MRDLGSGYIEKGAQAQARLCPRTGKPKRSCDCRPCLGGRTSREGKRKQRVAAKRLGVPKAKFHGQRGNEENWRGPFRDEVKSQGPASVVATKFLASEKQADQNKADGDARPVRATFMPPGWGSDGIVAVRLSVWEQHIQPLIDANGGLA